METYKFVGKKKHAYELVKENANCPDSEKTGSGPGSCGGATSSKSGKATKTQKLVPKEEIDKHMSTKGARKDFRTQRGNSIVQYTKGQKYPVEVETQWTYNNKPVQILHPGHDDRDANTAIVKSGSKTATITKGEKTSTVILDNGKSRTFDSNYSNYDDAKRFAANYVSEGPAFDIKDAIAKHGDSPVANEIKQLILNKMVDLAKYSKNPLTPESGSETRQQITLLGELLGMDEADWIPIREKVKK